MKAALPALALLALVLVAAAVVGACSIARTAVECAIYQNDINKRCN